MIIFSFVKTDKGPCPELIQFKNQSEALGRTFAVHDKGWNMRKPSREEDKLKSKLLKNEEERIKEFDQEKHLIKSFILANRKQSKNIEREKMLIYNNNESLNSTRESSNHSKRSYKLKSRRESGKSNKQYIQTAVEVL